MAKTTDLCVLCLTCDDPKLTYSVRYKNLFVKIKKYLGLTITPRLGTICLKCYHAVDNFHIFYESIQAAHKLLVNSSTVLTQSQIDENAILSVKIEVEDVALPDENNATSEEDECLSVIEEKYFVSVKNEDNGQNTGEREVLNVDKNTTQKNGLSVTKESNCRPMTTKDEVVGENTEQNRIELIINKENKTNGNNDDDTGMYENGKIFRPINEKYLDNFYTKECAKCIDQSLQFNTLKSLNDHYRIVHNTIGYVTCCKRKFKINTKNELHGHVFKHLRPESYMCKICGKPLSSLDSLKRHIILHKPVDERPYHCKLCNKSYGDKRNFEDHMNVQHVSEEKQHDHVCSTCGKRFKIISQLRRHNKFVHKNKRYMCEICAKCFSYPGGLAYHLGSVHNLPEPVQCAVCDKWFKNKSTLGKHRRLHENSSFPCQICSKVCKSNASLKSHLIKHSQERPHQCSSCEKTFKRKRHLMIHVKTQHTMSEKYSCPFCSKLFAHMSNFYKHKKRMHSDKNTKSSQKCPTVPDIAKQDSK